MPFLFSLQIASSSTSARPTLPCVSSSSTLPEDHEYAGHYKLVDGIQPARCWRRCLWNQNRFCPCSEHRQKHDAEEGACAINIDWSHPQHIHVNIFINLHACTCMVKTDDRLSLMFLFHFFTLVFVANIILIYLPGSGHCWRRWWWRGREWQEETFFLVSPSSEKIRQLIQNVKSNINQLQDKVTHSKGTFWAPTFMV